MKRLLVLMAAFVAMAVAGAAPQGQPQKALPWPVARPTPRVPSKAFATRALTALTSKTTISNARWGDLSRSRPDIVLGAMAAAEAKGWQPTSRTLEVQRRNGKNVPGISRVAVQDLYAATGDGEMLVWDWDDGNPNTAEGTVWAHSFVTGNEVTFNVQWAAGEASYNSSDITYYEGIDGVMTEAGLNNAALRGGAFARGRFLRVQYWGNLGQCEARGQYAGGRCIMGAARDYLREGIRNAAAGMAVGGVIGAWGGAAGGPATSLAGGISGAVAGAGPGFAGGVLYHLIWGTDYNCVTEARSTRDSCTQRLEACNMHTRSYELCEQEFGSPDRGRGGF